MADEVVSIKLKVEAHDRQLTQVIAKLKALEAVEKRLASGSRMQNFARNQSGALNSMTKGWKRHFDMVDAGIKMMGKGLTGFLKLAIKGVILEMGLLAASMIAVHAAFVAGQLIMKAYKGAMQLVAGAAAGTVVALAAVSSAIREQQAAIYAYRGKGAKEFGSAMSQTRMAMRSLQADAGLATLGVEALNEAYGVMSTTMNSRQIAGSTGAIKALMDFGSAGQDPAKGLQSVASVIAALNDPKKGMSAVRAEAKKLGPEMEKALKAANVQTKEQFSQLLYSGELAKLGGVQGQFGAINSTLIAQLKSYMTQIRTVFADYGDQFLEPLKVAFQDIFHILKRDIARIMGAVQLTIGTDGYIDGFVSMIDKTSNFMVKLVREHLPNAVGMFERIGNWMENFKRGWNDVLDYLRPLIDGARVLYKMLNPIWEAIKGGVDNLFLMKDLLIDNADTVEEFGERIGGFITALSELMMNMKKIFFDVLPLINDVIAGITQVFKMISGLLTSGAGGGLVKALAPLLAFSVIGRGMQNVKGRLMPGSTPFNNPNTMNVQAGVVNIAGPGGAVGGAGLSSGRTGAGAGGAGRLASGATYGPALPPGSMRLRDLKNQAGMRMGALMREGIGAATRNMNHASIIAGGNATIAGRPGFLSTLAGGNRGIGMSYADSLGMTPFERGQRTATDYQRREDLMQGARNSLSNAKTRAKQAAEIANYRARQGFGAFRGMMGYAGSGAWDESMGAYKDVSAERFKLRNNLNMNLGREYIDPETGAVVPAGGGQSSAGRLTRARLIMREKLDQNRITRSSTKFGAGVGKFQNSMGGRMGTSLGLAAASQFAPQEMQGAMALGGMVGQFNPLAGIGVAGIGGALSSRSAGAGALSGAAGGAAIGAMFGPWGAAIGGGIGLVVGGIVGAVNKGRYQLSQARKAAESSFNTLYEGVAKESSKKFTEFQQIISSGGTIEPGTIGAFQNQAQDVGLRQKRLIDFMDSQLGPTSQPTADQVIPMLEELYRNQGNFGITITADEMKDMSKSTQTALVGLEKYGTMALEAEKPLEAIQNQTTARMEMLTKMTGKTVPELEVMAQEIGYNLYDATVDFNQVVKELGASVLKTGNQFKFAMQDVFLAGSEPFRKSIEQREGESAVNQSAAALQAVLTSGASTEEKNIKLEQTMADFFPQMLAASGGDPIAAYLSTQAMFGQGPKGGAFAEGATYAGQGEFFAQNTAFQGMLTQQKEAMPKLAAEQLSAYVYSKTGQAVDVGTLIPAIGKMTAEQQNKLLTDLSTLDQNTLVQTGTSPFDMTETNALKGITAYSGDTQIQDVLSGLGITGAGLVKAGEEVNIVSDAIANLYDPMDKLGTSTEALKTQTEKLNENFGKYFTGNVPEEKKDTSSPRGGRIGDTTTSRLSQTMGRHAMLDSQLTGKRTITSAFRTWGLGSPSSDHVTGRAYDLVGQNLGQYSKLVHANGGFAEFHGAAANRHLHVVPGPGMGDTTTMRATVGAASAGGNTTNYYNFEINGTGMDPEAVAQMVMSKIKETERVNRERS